MKLLTYNYRLAFLVTMAQFFVPPLLMTAAYVRLGPEITAPFLIRLLYVLSVPLYWTMKIQYSVYSKKRDAALKGAVLPPEVKGKWPGNIDLLPGLFERVESGNIGLWFDDYFDEVGSNTINLRLLWRDWIISRDHHVMQTVLATGFPDFAKGSTIKLRFAGLFGDGIFNADGEEWKAHRALTRPFFARERVTDFEHFDRYAEKLIDIFRTRALAGQSVDVQDVFGRFTLDAAGEFLFGNPEFNTLDLPSPLPGHTHLGMKGSRAEGEYGDFLNAFEAIQTVMPFRFAQPMLWPAFEFLKDMTAQHNKTIDRVIGPLVQKALSEKALRNNDKSNLEDGSLVDHLAETTDNPTVIRDELFNILLAARDTTACLLTYLMYLLALRPDAVKRLREEILAAVPSGPPTFDDIRKLKYLRACLNETLRLFPPVPLNERASTRNSVLPSAPGSKPFHMPGPDVTIVYCTMSIQRRPDLWGSDAGEFLPERWIQPERLRTLTVDPFKFLPFNAGPRICLGQNFAYNEASFLVVRLMQAFDTFELRQKEDAPAGSLPPTSWRQSKGREATEQVWPRSDITLYSKVRA